MKTRNRWTVEDTTNLKKYSGKGIEKLKEVFPERSEQAIKTKCCYLNLSIGETNMITERLFMV